MLPARHAWIASLVLGAAASSALHAQDGVSTANFSKLRDLIRPQPGESNWRNVEWFTSLHEARLKAAAEGKPILVWSGGGAPPLGGC